MVTLFSILVLHTLTSDTCNIANIYCTFPIRGAAALWRHQTCSVKEPLHEYLLEVKNRLSIAFTFLNNLLPLLVLLARLY